MIRLEICFAKFANYPDIYILHLRQFLQQLLHQIIAVHLAHNQQVDKAVVIKSATTGPERSERKKSLLA
jgi:tRNA G37 N-methylase Trm5